MPIRAKRDARQTQAKTDTHIEITPYMSMLEVHTPNHKPLRRSSQCMQYQDNHVNEIRQGFRRKDRGSGLEGSRVDKKIGLDSRVIFMIDVRNSKRMNINKNKNKNIKYNRLYDPI